MLKNLYRCKVNRRLIHFSVLAFFTPFLIMGAWVEPLQAGSRIAGGKSFSTHPGTFQSAFRSHLPSIRGIRSRSGMIMNPQRTLRGSHGKSFFRNRFLKRRNHLAHFPFILRPGISEYSEQIVIILSKEDFVDDGSHQEEAKPTPLPPPLIIEERCGQYITLPWPESGRLDEGHEEEPCPESSGLSPGSDTP